MKSLFISFILLLAIINKTNAQLKVKEHVWASATPTQNIPDSLNTHDAVMVHYQHDIKNILDLSAGQAYNIESIRIRVKINTQSGLDDYATYSILKSKNSTVTKLDARTIKQSGKIVDLVNTDIKLLNIKPDENNSNLLNMRVSIPGVEIGDEIEIIYTLENEGLKIGRDIKMHTDIPTLKSVFSYTTDNSIITDLMMYNEMPDPVIVKAMNESTFTWTLENLQGLGSQFASDFTENLPYIRFAVRMVVIGGRVLPNLAQYGILKNDWSEIYDYYTNISYNPNFGKDYKGTSFTRIIKDYNLKNPTLTSADKIQYLVNYINDSISITSLPNDQLNRSAIFYIENKKIDEKNVYNFIREYLSENKIKYYVVFARDRREGRMDINFTSVDMISEVFFAIEDEKGNKHLLYPPTENRKYLLDEIPDRIAGTEAIMVNRKTDNSTKSEVLKIKTPKNEFHINKRNTMVNIQVKLMNNNECEYKTKNSFTGDFSTRYRNLVIEAKDVEKPNETLKEDLGILENYDVDTFTVENLDAKYPYNFTFNYAGKAKISHQKLDAKTYSIPLIGLLDHFTLRTNDESRELNYLCPFKYEDTYKVYIQFDKAIELLPTSLEDFWVFDKVGNYIINVNKVNDKIILIESKLDIRKDKLDPTEYKTLHDINESIRKTTQSRLIVKTI